MTHTYELIKIIGSPLVDETPDVPFDVLEAVYEKAFADRVALLYLSIHRKKGWPESLEKKYHHLSDRRNKTLDVIASLGKTLNEFSAQDYAIFKSLKPYPATPNDTDVIFFGHEQRFKNIINHLYSKDYFFHEWAPMQTTVCDPRGKGKIGKGKKGGIYYIDVYSDISTDYFCYIDKRSLIPNVETTELNGQKIRNVSKEIELAIILFHNIFPERTFQLEHFYVPLYLIKEQNFNLNKTIQFAKEQRLSYALMTNLTIVEYIHEKIFGFAPPDITCILEELGRNIDELERFKTAGENTPYMFSPKTFWITFLNKIRDRAAFRSLFLQGLHMLNPIFFLDVAKSLRNRFSEKGIYHLE